MRRTVAGSMAATIPSLTAWRASAALLQWVTCRPQAIGSRQASSTIWARWRGGNPGRTPRPLRRREQPGEPLAAVPLTGPPDRGGVALGRGGDLLHPLAAGDGQ